MGLVPMDTIIGDHRSVLVDKLNQKLVTPPNTESRSSAARVIPAHKKQRTTAHLSWSDVVKSRPIKGPKASLQLLSAR
jgi:hypothetical protein